MRSGVNPQKFKQEENIPKFHRVIIPVHIPNITEEYYKESLQVLEYCFKSLFQTINPEFTSVTIVNNNSHSDANKIIDSFLIDGKIDKYIEYGENKGKVYAVINEARSSYEPFITIADADVLFFPGWEKAVFKIFIAYNKAGVVSPVPSQNLGLYKNCSIFFDKYLNRCIKYAKVVKDEDCDLFLKGLGNSELLTRNNSKYSWKEKQYYLQDPVQALIGANHYVATYRKEVLVYNKTFPTSKFKKGYEEKYLDEPSDKLGWYRLSTPQTFAYHVGNKTDDIISRNNSSNDLLTKDDIEGINSVKKSPIPYILKRLFFKSLRKIKQL